MERPRDFFRVDVLERNQSRDQRVGVGTRFTDIGAQLLLTRVAGAGDAKVLPRRNNGELVHVESRQERAPRVAHGDRGVGDDRDLAFDFLVDEEVLPRELAHGLGQIHDVGVREVEVGDDVIGAFAAEAINECGSRLVVHHRKSLRRTPGDTDPSGATRGRRTVAVGLTSGGESARPGGRSRGGLEVDVLIAFEIFFIVFLEEVGWGALADAALIGEGIGGSIEGTRSRRECGRPRIGRAGGVGEQREEDAQGDEPQKPRRDFKPKQTRVACLKRGLDWLIGCHR